MITSIAETLNEIGDGNGNISDSAGERSTQFKEDGSDTYGYGSTIVYTLHCIWPESAVFLVFIMI